LFVIDDVETVGADGKSVLISEGSPEEQA